MLIDDVVHGGVEVLVVVWRTYVHDLGSGRHAVHRLDIQRLLAVPALRILPRILRTVVHAWRHYLYQLARSHRGQTPILRPLIDILENSGRGVGIDDGDRLATPVISRDPVSTLDLVRRRARDGPRRGGKLDGGESRRKGIRREQLRPIGRQGRRVPKAG